MKIVGIVLLVLVLLIAGAVFIGPSLVPRDWLVAQLGQAVRNATGRDLKIDGDVSLSLLPTTHVSASGVTFGAETTPPLLTLDRLEVNVSPMALLRRQIQVDRFVLVRPKVTLAVDKAGKANWQMAQPAGSTQPTTGGQAPADGGAGSSSGGSAMPADIRLGEVRLEDGTVGYSDARSGRTEQLDKVNLTLNMPQLDGPADLAGTAEYHAKPIQLDLKLANAMQAAQNGASPGSVVIKGPVNLSLNGTLSATPKGRLEIATPDLPAALTWLQVAVPATAPMPKQLTLQTDLTSAPNVYTLDNIQLTSDLMNGLGALQAKLDGARPAINARFKTGMVDVDKLLAPAAAPAPASPPPAAPAQSAPAAPAPAATDPALGIPTGLPIDLEAAFEVDGVKARGYQLGHSRVRVAGAERNVRIELDEINAYGGKLTGRVVGAPDAQNNPRVALNLIGNGVQVGPLLEAAAGQKRLDGTMSANVQVAGDGRTKNSLLATLDGKVGLSLADAVLTGIDLTKFTGDPTTIAAVIASKGWGGTTRIGRASANFAVSDGVASTDDLVVLAAPVQATGSGKVVLPEQRLDGFRIVTGPVPGTGGALGNVPRIPITLSGPIASPSINVDAGSVVQDLLKDPKNQQRIIDQVDKITGGKGAVGGILNNLLGGNR